MHYHTVWNFWQNNFTKKAPFNGTHLSFSFQHRFKLLSIPWHSEICQITFEAFASFQLSTIWRFIIGGHVSLDLASSHICSIAFHLSQYYSHSLGSLQFPGFLWKTICGSYFRLLRRNMWCRWQGWPATILTLWSHNIRTFTMWPIYRTRKTFEAPETLPGCQQQQKVALEEVRLPSVAVNPLSNC